MVGRGDLVDILKLASMSSGIKLTITLNGIMKKKIRNNNKKYI